MGMGMGMARGVEGGGGDDVMTFSFFFVVFFSLLDIPLLSFLISNLSILRYGTAVVSSIFNLSFSHRCDRYR